MGSSSRFTVFFSLISLLACFTAASSFADLDAPHARVVRAAAPAAPAATADADACAGLLTDAIPLDWVQKMLKEGKASDPQVQRLRDIVQRFGFNQAALNVALLKSHNNNYTVEVEQGHPTDQARSGRCWIFAGLNMLRSTLIAEGRVPGDTHDPGKPGFEFSQNYLYFYSMLEQSNKYVEKIIDKTFQSVTAKPDPKADPKGHQDNDAIFDMTNASKPAKLSRKELESALTPDISDGGYYMYFMQLVAKYGLVPNKAMPDTQSAVNSNVLNSELQNALAQTARDILLESQNFAKEHNGQKVKVADYLNDLRAIKTRGMQTVWRILATHLGDPPSEFDFRVDGKTTKDGNAQLTPARVYHFTPKDFAEKFVEFHPEDYVVVSVAPHQKQGEVYEVEKSAIGPSTEGGPAYNLRFLNTDINRLEELAATSIRGGEPVWFAADVTKDVELHTGIMHPDIYVRDPIYNIPKNEQTAPLGRDLANMFGLLGPNHAMVLTGFDQPNPKGPIVKFKDENSWGDDVGHNGSMALYDEWFKQNVFEIIVHKRFLSDTERAAWEGKATTLGEDDLTY